MNNKGMRIKPQLPRGMRDFLPDAMQKRQAVFRKIQDIFEKYGFAPLETPAIERLDVLTGKYGEESDRLIFKILKRGDALGEKGTELSDMGLRYDLTVPLGRVVAMHAQNIKLPFKRYQMQPVWRAEKPQRGRFREFYQCDVDIVGIEDISADAEIMALVHEILEVLGLPNFRIHFNHRKILSGMAEVLDVPTSKANLFFVTLDKMDKVGFAGVKREMEERGISREAIAGLENFSKISGDAETVFEMTATMLKSSGTGKEGIEETKKLYDLAKALNIPEKHLCFDIFLARGLEYYTGPIYESVIKDPPIGSLTGGGRYDELIGMFLGTHIPATGTSIGIERILAILDELDLMPETRSCVEVLVAYTAASLQEAAMELTATLRKAGLKTEVYLSPSRLKKQLRYADTRGIPFAVIMGEEEWNSRQIILRNMVKKSQQLVQADNLSQTIGEAVSCLVAEFKQSSNP